MLYGCNNVGLIASRSCASKETNKVAKGRVNGGRLVRL